MPQRPAPPPFTPLDFKASALTTFGESLPGPLGPSSAWILGWRWGQAGATQQLISERLGAPLIL